jgi:hypothetical protein
MADADVLNSWTQLKTVCHVGMFPFLPMPECRRSIRFVSVAESLLLKNASMANARCSLDQRSMPTKGDQQMLDDLWSTSPLIAVCRVSTARHFIKHGSSARFKSSNCFLNRPNTILPTRITLELILHEFHGTRRGKWCTVLGGVLPEIQCGSSKWHYFQKVTI